MEVKAGQIVVIKGVAYAFDNNSAELFNVWLKLREPGTELEITVYLQSVKEGGGFISSKPLSPDSILKALSSQEG